MAVRIFVTQPVSESALARLRAIAEVTANSDARQVIPRDRLIAGVRGCDILFSLLHDRIDGEVIAANPKLRAIASMSITPDNIDVASATSRRIPVTVVPALAVESTADTHFALLLAVARRVVEGDQLVRGGIFPGSQANYLLGSGVHGKTIGLVGGRGRIGRAVAARAKGFSMRILYHDAVRAPEALEKSLNLEFVSAEELLRQSDFISLHVPLLPETRHMIGAEQLRMMKASAILVNTSRGPVVDEAALAEALERKTIAGAGLDVFEQEPKVQPLLLKLENVVLAPHIASASIDTRRKMSVMAAENALAALAGRRPPNLLNPS